MIIERVNGRRDIEAQSCLAWLIGRRHFARHGLPARRYHRCRSGGHRQISGFRFFNLRLTAIQCQNGRARHFTAQTIGLHEINRPRQTEAEIIQGKCVGSGGAIGEIERAPDTDQAIVAHFNQARQLAFNRIRQFGNIGVGFGRRAHRIFQFALQLTLPIFRNIDHKHFDQNLLIGLVKAFHQLRHQFNVMAETGNHHRIANRSNGGTAKSGIGQENRCCGFFSLFLFRVRDNRGRRCFTGHIARGLRSLAITILRHQIAGNIGDAGADKSFLQRVENRQTVFCRLAGTRFSFALLFLTGNALGFGTLLRRFLRRNHFIGVKLLKIAGQFGLDFGHAVAAAAIATGRAFAVKNSEFFSENRLSGFQIGVADNAAAQLIGIGHIGKAGLGRCVLNLRDAVIGQRVLRVGICRTRRLCRQSHQHIIKQGLFIGPFARQHGQSLVNIFQLELRGLGLGRLLLPLGCMLQIQRIKVALILQSRLFEGDNGTGNGR